MGSTRRRWVDADILAKTLGGLIFLGISFGAWQNGRFWPWGWAVGGGLFLWGVMSIGDPQKDDVV